MFLVNWEGNYNYWTGGVRQCGEKWAWCRTSGDLTPLDAALGWDVGQPDNKTGAEFCVHLKIQKNEAPGIKLTDKNCASKFIYACQVDMI